VIVVTDNLVPFPCVPWQIQGKPCRHVVEVDRSATPPRFVSGTTQITRSPDRLRIAEFVARFLARSWNHEERLLVPSRRRSIALAFVDYCVA